MNEKDVMSVLNLKKQKGVCKHIFDTIYSGKLGSTVKISTFVDKNILTF